MPLEEELPATPDELQELEVLELLSEELLIEELETEELETDELETDELLIEEELLIDSDNETIYTVPFGDTVILVFVTVSLT